MNKILDILSQLGLKTFFVLIIASILGGLLSLSAYNTFRTIGKEGRGIQDFFSTPQPEINNLTEEVQIIPTIDVLLEAPKWDGANRVTVLVMGLDFRDWESNSTASRSDTMILLTLDPVTKNAGILSIPRDLWANIPGFNPGKINTAHYFGELYKVPGGGPALAMQTVEATLGIPIDYYARIDFFAFEKFIDDIGGVQVDIPARIRVHPIGHKSRYLEPGVQVLPGYLALAYARVRNSDGGDFSRAERQQQVILGIRDRLLDTQTFSHVVENSSTIYANIASGISTNLSLDDVIRLAFVAIQVDSSNIKQGVIDERYVNFGTSPDDLAILIPLPDKIRTLRDEIFTSNSVLGPFTPGSDRDQMNAEFASITIVNGTNSGNANDRIGSFLISNGANVISFSNTNQNYYNSSVTDYKGRPYTVKYLVNLFNIPQENIKFEYDPNRQVDIELTIGNQALNIEGIP